MNITVRGLKGTDADNYSFSISNSSNGYYFTGTPVLNTSKLKEQGAFNTKQEYISPTPYLLTHSDNEPNGDIWVNILEKTETGETSITGSNKDSNGNFITLISGRTTNVLMEIGVNGKLSVYVKVTPLDEIHQWTEY